MTTATVDTVPLVTDFEATAVRRAGDPAAVATLRRRAVERFVEIGFPTRRAEDWRFTNVGPISRTRYEVASGPSAIGEDALDPFIFDEMATAVFVDGFFVPERSNLEGLPAGTEVGSLATVLRDGHPAIAELGRHAAFDEQAFVAWNTALFADGAFVHVPRGAVVARPIEIVFAATGGASPRVNFPRTLVVAEENSQVTLVETYAGLGSGYLTVPVTEMVAGPASVVDHYRLQHESLDASHVGLQQYVCSRDASFSSSSLSFGGALVRNDVRAVLAGQGIDCTLNGLYLTKDSQHVDNHMWVEHREPHCDSHELYKGILEGASRAVFNGLIHVFEGAQKTDAKQTNRNLLLSPSAIVNTNPQLVIFTDDVKCTHGSTVGQLDADALFYLRSRGIGEDAAKSLLIYAFASEVVQAIRLEAVRRDLEELLFARLPKGDVVRQAV